MENEVLSDSLSIVRLISEQFLCCTVLKKINWQSIFEILSTESEEENYKLQDYLLSQTVNHPVNQKFPLKKSYQQDFLKYIILTLEERNLEISESLYSKFQELLNSSTCHSDFNFKHYCPSNGQFVTLSESTSIISEGTTGLCSWQGAFVLAEWCLKNASALKGKGILELGSGVGLTGLVICTTCNPKYILFSDVHDTVLSQLCLNIRINTGITDIPGGSLNSSNENAILNASWNDTRIQVLKLDWLSFDLDTVFCDLDLPDIILAADVVYDPSLIAPLCEVLKAFLKRKEDILIIFACTVRSQETHELFLKTLDKMGMTPQSIQYDWSPIFHFSILGTVLLYSICKQP